MKIHALWLSASVFALASGGFAHAQTDNNNDAKAKDGVQEVVVTAERRSTSVQTTPIAATVLSGGDLAKKGVLTIDQLQFALPGATINNFGQGIDFNIRGIGKAEHNSQTTTGVIVYRDGISTFPGYFQEEPYFDIARVEVLRGPQGTFVGQNATGGAVFITSQDPIINGGYHGYIQGQVGNYSDVGGQGAINLPISDTLAARVAFNSEARNSFYTINGAGSTNPGINDESARFSILWKPTSALSVLFKIDGDYLNQGGYPADPVLSTNNPFHITGNFPQQGVDRFMRSDLKVDYVLPDGITLRSISGYQKGNTKYLTDLDGTSLANYTFGDYVKEDIFSQEFNIISPDTGPITYVLGAYYQSDRLNFPPNQFFIGEPAGSIYSSYYLQGKNPKENLAGFGQVSFKLPDGFELQVGGRYTHATTANSNVQILQFGTPILDDQKQSFSNFSGKVSLNWTINPHNFVYAFVATGFRPGGLNAPVGLGLPAPFTSEKITEYEVGWKAGFFNGHLRTQLDAYYNDYKNFQVSIGYPAFPTFGIELNDASTTKIYGMEFQTEAVFGHLSFDSGLGLMHSSLGTFYAVDPRIGSTGACDPATGPVSASCIALGGRQQTYAPNFTFNIGGQYAFELPRGDTLTPRINYGHVSSQYATLFEDAALGDRVGARNVFTLQAAWTHGDLVATVYSTNLTNEKYVGAVNSGLRFEGPPRQYGIRLLKVF